MQPFSVGSVGAVSHDDGADTEDLDVHPDV